MLNQLSILFHLKITIYIKLANILGNTDFEIGVRDHNMQFTFLQAYMGTLGPPGGEV